MNTKNRGAEPLASPCDKRGCDRPSVVTVSGTYQEYPGAASQTWYAYFCAEHAGERDMEIEDLDEDDGIEVEDVDDVVLPTSLSA